MSGAAPVEVLVIGGGIAGSMLAAELARAGREVLLVERTSGPHAKMCGEFLSYEALGYLAQAGLCVERLGAIPLDRLRLFSGSQSVETPLPFAACSLGRAVLDEALLKAAAAAGVTLARGEGVDRLTRSAGGETWEARLGGASAHGRSMHARSVFLATGKHDLRGWPRPPGRENQLLAFKMYFRLSPSGAAALGSAVELALFPGGYAGLQPSAGGMANLCLVVHRDAYAALRRKAGSDRNAQRDGATGNHQATGSDGWALLLAFILQGAPQLVERLAGAEPVWQKPLALSSIPYGLVMRTTEPGLWRLGDQAAVIQSFAGEGMALAMHGAHLAASLYLSGGSSALYQTRLARELSSQVQRASLLTKLLERAPALSLRVARIYPAGLQQVARATRIGKHHLFNGSRM